MIDKEKIEEGVNEYYPYLEGKEMIHPINYQRAKQRDAFLTGVEWALKQVKKLNIDDVSKPFYCNDANIDEAAENYPVKVCKEQCSECKNVC